MQLVSFHLMIFITVSYYETNVGIMTSQCELLLYRAFPLEFSYHLPKHIRNFAAIGGYSLLWPEATAFLRHKGAYSRPEVAIVACGPRPQGFISHNSKPTPVRMANTRGVKRFEGQKVQSVGGDRTRQFTIGPYGKFPVLTIKVSIYKSQKDCLLSQSNIQCKKLFLK